MRIGGIDVLLHESGDPANPLNTTEPLPLRAPRQDTSTNPAESRPEYGDFFGQSDFRNGALQQWFHKTGSDPKRFFNSEGLDPFHTHAVSLGTAIHLMLLDEVAENAPPAAVGTNTPVVDVCQNIQFLAWGDTVYKRTSPTGGWTEESPHLAEGKVQVHDLAVAGSEMYYALGTNGIHKRDTAGTITHYNAALATRVAFVKDRLMATSARAVYEIVASGAAPSPIETVPEGWESTDIWEANGYIYISFVHVTSGLSRVHHYGLNDTGTAVAKIGSTPMPRDQLVRTGRGYLGQCYLGVGKRNTSGGYEPVFYQAIIDGEGFLNIVKIAEGTGAGARDLAIRHIEPYGENLLMSWSLGSGATFGSREGLAVFNPGRDGFATHLRDSSRDGTATADSVYSISIYQGHICYATPSRFRRQDHTALENSCEFVSSIGDQNSEGNKTYDYIEVATYPLPVGTSVGVYYTTDPPEDENWTLAGTHSGTGNTTSRFAISVTAPQIAVRLVPVPVGTTQPEIVGFRVRSNPFPDKREWVLTRTVRLQEEDRSEPNARPVQQDVVAKYKQLQDLMYTKVTVEEPGGLEWDCRVEAVADYKPALELQGLVTGNPQNMAFFIRITLTGSRVDA